MDEVRHEVLANLAAQLLELREMLKENNQKTFSTKYF